MSNQTQPQIRQTKTAVSVFTTASAYPLNVSGTIAPAHRGVFDLGSPSLPFRNVYGTASAATTASYSQQSSTASYSVSASHAVNSDTASFSTTSTTSSYALNVSGSAGSSATASYISGTIIFSGPVPSSSFAITASYAMNGGTGGGGTTLSTGSFYPISCSQATSASYAPGSPSVSASYANHADTASYFNGSVSTASYALVGDNPLVHWRPQDSLHGNEVTRSAVQMYANDQNFQNFTLVDGGDEALYLLALANQTGNTVLASPVGGGSGTPSFRKIVPNDLSTASGSYGITVTNAATASLLLGSVVSASFATTASYAMNGGGGGGTTLTTGSTYPITSSWAVNVVNGGSGGTDVLQVQMFS